MMNIFVSLIYLWTVTISMRENKHLGPIDHFITSKKLFSSRKLLFALFAISSFAPKMSFLPEWPIQWPDYHQMPTYNHSFNGKKVIQDEIYHHCSKHKQMYKCWKDSCTHEISNLAEWIEEAVHSWINAGVTLIHYFFKFLW